MIYVGKTPDFIHRLVCKMHANGIRRKKSPSSFECFSICDENKMNIDERYIMAAATGIMNSQGFLVRNKREKRNKQEKREILFEYHMYNVNGPVETMIGLHRDNHSGVDGKVHTMIIIAEKDERIKGGNFIYIDDNGNEVIIETKAGMFIIIDGDLEHTPQNLDGVGVRSSIVIQIEQS